MSIVRDALIDELREKIIESNDYASKIEQAKTETKRKSYKKKLHKSNNIIAELLIRLEEFDKNVEKNKK